MERKQEEKQSKYKQGAVLHASRWRGLRNIPFKTHTYTLLRHWSLCDCHPWTSRPRAHHHKQVTRQKWRPWHSRWIKAHQMEKHHLGKNFDPK